MNMHLVLSCVVLAAAAAAAAAAASGEHTPVHHGLDGVTLLCRTHQCLCGCVAHTDSTSQPVATLWQCLHVLTRTPRRVHRMCVCLYSC